MFSWICPIRYQLRLKVKPVKPLWCLSIFAVSQRKTSVTKSPFYGRQIWLMHIISKVNDFPLHQTGNFPKVYTGGTHQPRIFGQILLNHFGEMYLPCFFWKYEIDFCRKFVVLSFWVSYPQLFFAFPVAYLYTYNRQFNLFGFPYRNLFSAVLERRTEILPSFL